MSEDPKPEDKASQDAHIARLYAKYMRCLLKDHDGLNSRLSEWLEYIANFIESPYSKTSLKVKLPPRFGVDDHGYVVPMKSGEFLDFDHVVAALKSAGVEVQP